MTTARGDDASEGSPIRDSPSLMRRSPWAAHLYRRLPTTSLKYRAILWRLIRAEGGAMTSLTMRAIMRDLGVEVGDYSYGSLARPEGRTEAGTVIGRYVSIGPDCWAYRSNHPVGAQSLHPYWFVDAAHNQLGRDMRLYEHDTGARLDIEHDAWIGANVVIVRSCSRIGVGAVIGAGAVVTSDIPDFAIAVGNPARVIRQRLSDASVDSLMNGRPWLLNPDAARRWYLENELPVNLLASARGAVH